MPTSNRLLCAPDARAAEAALLALLDELLPAGRAADGSTRAPVRVLVPSNSLRVDLLARLAQRRPAWIGLEVSTLRTFALELLRADGEPPPRGAALLAIELERAARRRRPLVAAFHEFTDGWSALAAAARDLVDAGFVPELLEPMQELLQAEAPQLAARTALRARELFEALAEALRRLDEQGLAPDAHLWARASERISSPGAASGGPLRRARATVLHGFADATGAVADLLAALARQPETRVLLPTPGDVSGDSGLPRFGARLRERFEAAAGPPQLLPATAAAPVVRELVAPTPDLEVRAIAFAVAADLEAGVSAERIAIVLRDPSRYRAHLSRELARQGIPFSGSTAFGPPAPELRRAGVLLAALERADDCPIEVALGLAGDSARSDSAAIALALGSLGIHRLGGVRVLAPGSFARWRERGFPLPVRAAIETIEPDDGAATGNDAAALDAATRPQQSTLARRRIAVTSLELAVVALQSLHSALAALPPEGTWQEMAAGVTRVATVLGRHAELERSLLLSALARVELDLPAGYRIDRRELLGLLHTALEADGRRPLGGCGGGVQLLSVVEARGRTFDRLYLPGLVRGHFPRPVAAEPVLPDGLRRRLRELLPDLPVKAEGHDEDRFLFAQLLGAAPQVVLSRPRHDEGKPLTASPLLEAVRRGTELSVLAVEPGELSLLDRAIAAGLQAGAAALPDLLPVALEEGRRRYAPSAPEAPLSAAGSARWRILVEFDADPRARAWPARLQPFGPYSGFTGRADLLAPPSATLLEGLAHCAWQAFLQRDLRLAPLPDPEALLPEVDRRWVGTVVHEVLAQLAREADDGRAPALRFAATSRQPGTPIRWPDDAQLAELVRNSVTATLDAAGRPHAALARLVEREALERLLVVRRLDEAEPAAWIGAEVEGTAVVAGAAVRFRVDRLSRLGERLVLTDFKIGAPDSTLRLKTVKARVRRLLAEVRSGARLQAALYLAAAAAEGQPALARYTFLDPDLEEPLRQHELEASAETAEALEHAATVLLTARRRGLHPPRLLEPNRNQEFSGCAWCEVAEACVRGDSGFRVRLERWHEHQEQRVERSEPDETLWRLWRLPAAEAQHVSEEESS